MLQTQELLILKRLPNHCSALLPLQLSSEIVINFASKESSWWTEVKLGSIAFIQNSGVKFAASNSHLTVFFNYEIEATSLKLWPVCFKAILIFPVTSSSIKYTTYSCHSCLGYKFKIPSRVWYQITVFCLILIQYNKNYAEQYCHIQFKYNQQQVRESLKIRHCLSAGPEF